jgi:hypothetical protein
MAVVRMIFGEVRIEPRLVSQVRKEDLLNECWWEQDTGAS